MPKEKKDFWRKASEPERYDYLVNGPYAIEEIQNFHSAEDIIIQNALNYFKPENNPLVIVEEGCGPGRIIERLAELSLMTSPPQIPKIPDHIVGVDFEQNMLVNCTEHLIGRGGIIRRTDRNWQFKSVAFKLLGKETSLKKYNEMVRKRVSLIKADMKKPHLAINQISSLIIMGFGTLGNIEKPEKALKTIADICGRRGYIFISVFNKQNYHIGELRYSKLAEQTFRPLKNTTYKKNKNSVIFTSPSGFYSKWFDEEEFKNALKEYFDINDKIKTFADGVGLYVLTKPKTDFLSSVKDKLRISHRSTSKYSHGIHLLCPACGSYLKDGSLPLNIPSNKKVLVCSKNKEHNYDVKEINGFLIPFLEV